MSQLVDVGGEQHEFPDEATPEQITTALRGYGSVSSNTLTPEQSSLLSGIDMTPFHTSPGDSKTALQITPEPTGIEAALSNAYQSGRRLLSPLIGPTQSEKMEQSIPWGIGPNEEHKYAYKPLGDAATKLGLIPAVMDAGSAMLDVPSAVQLAQQGKPLTIENVEAQRANQGFQAQPNDSAVVSILKGAANATTNFSHAIGSPVTMALGPSRLVSGYFGADMLSNVPQQVRQGMNAPDLQGQVEGWLGAGSSLLMGGAALAHSAVSPDDIAARSLLNRQAPVTPPATMDVSAPSAGAEPTSLLSPSVGTSNVGAPIEKNISDMLMMNGGDHEAAATMAEKYGMPDVANQIRARAPLPSAVEPTPLFGQGTVPIMGGEGTPVEGAPSPGAPLLRPNDPLAFQPPPVTGQLGTSEIAPSANSLLSQFHMEQDPIRKQALWQQAKAAAENGPDFVPPSDISAAGDQKQLLNSSEPPASPTPSPDTTSLKRAVVDTERENRGEPEIPTAQVVGDQQAVDNAKSMLDQDPTAGQTVVARINGGDPRISKQDAGLLLAERNRIVQQRTQWEERAAQSTDPTERATADQQLQQIEQQLTAVDNASRTAGSEWSGVGHMYQSNIAKDYSLTALERKARAAKAIATGDGSLSTEELSTVQQQAADYQKLQSEAAEKQQALESAQKDQQAQADTIRAHEQTIKEMQQAEAARPKFGKTVLDQAQKIVDRLKVNADASRIKLRQALSQMNAGVDPTVIVHAANILAHKVGELGLKKAEAFAQMVDEFGEKVAPHLEKAWKAAKKLIGAEAAPDEVKKAVKSGVKKEPTSTDAAARLKADATAGDELSHKAVYDVWSAKVREGITDVDKAAKATHETVQQSYPEATEKQVREAFSEYGKVKFPSKEADKVTLAEHRRITQLQLSIDRLKQGLDPLHTGLQRDKATQPIREKQAQLNELLKQKTGPPSPEALAGRNEARKTALRNSIADLDKQLQTGVKPVDTSTPLPYDPEVERLTAERDAMKEKLAEIEVEANPPPTPAEQQVAHLSKVKQRVEDTLSGKIDPKTGKPFEALSPKAEDLQMEIQAMQELSAQMKRDAKPVDDPDAKAEAAKIKALDDSIERYRQNTETLAKGGAVESRGAMHGPDTAEVAARKEVLESRKSMYETAKKAGVVVRTPEEIYNARRTSQIERESKKAQARIDAGDYGPRPPKPPKELFDATQESLAKLSALRLKIKAGQEAWKKNNRTGPEKFWDRFVGIQRAMKLTSDVVLAKLSLAALAREALTPAEEGIGGFYSKAFPLLAERAPREGGFSLQAEAIAKAAMFTDGMKDAADNLKFKESQLSLVHDKQLKAAPEWWDYMGFLHAALKAPVKRAEFARSLAKRTEWAMNEGRDTNDPKVMKELAQEAYVDGQRAIFMQDNAISDFINHSLAMMKNSKQWPNAGAGLSRLGHFLLPVIKVPTNIVGEVATGIHGAPTGLVRTAKAYLDGIGNLKPQEADSIMRQLKKGSIGGAFLLTGYLASKSIGGFYHANDHRNRNDVQPDHYRIGGIDLPSWFSHSTAAMLLNIGATVARVENETTHGQKKGLGTGAVVAGQGLIRKLPFVPAVTNTVDAVHDEGGFRKYIHSMLLSSTVPALIQHLAKVEDTPGDFPSNILTPENRRTPTTATEAVESGIPLLRRSVPFSRGYRPPPTKTFLQRSTPPPNTNRLFQTTP